MTSVHLDIIVHYSHLSNQMSNIYIPTIHFTNIEKEKILIIIVVFVGTISNHSFRNITQNRPIVVVTIQTLNKA